MREFVKETMDNTDAVFTDLWHGATIVDVALAKCQNESDPDGRAHHLGLSRWSPY